MHKWWKQFKLENRFIYRNWFLIAAPVAFALSMYLSFSLSLLSNSDMANLTDRFFKNFYDFQQLIHTMTLGIVMFLGVFSTRRHYNKGAYELYGAWPVSQTTIISTKFIAAILYFSIYTALMGIVFWLRAMQYGISASVAGNQLIHNVLQYEWSFCVTLALGMFLAVTIPGRIAYLIAFCGWMFGTYFMDIFVISRFELFYLKVFHLNKYFLYSLSPIESYTTWGVNLNAYETWFSRLIVMAFTVLLGIIMVWILKNKRPTRSSGKWGLISVVIVLLTATSAIPYANFWSDRYKTYAAHEKEAVSYGADHPHSGEAEEVKEENSGDLPATGTYRFPVSTYDINATQTGRKTLAVNAKITVPQKSLDKKPLIFTLNRSLQIDQLTHDGDPVDYTRKGDLIEIDDVGDMKADTLTLSFQYKGEIEEWSHAYGDESSHAFIRNRDIFLPSYIAWYPLPGKQPLYYHYKIMAGPKIKINQENGLTKDGANFSVTLNGFHNKTFATIDEKRDTGKSQTFKESKAQGVTLVAGNLYEATVPEKNVALMGPSSHKQEMQSLKKRFAGYAAYYRNWLGLPGRTTKILFLPTNYIDERSWITVDSSEIVSIGTISDIYENEGTAQRTEMNDAFQAAMLFRKPGKYDRYQNDHPNILSTIRQAITEMYDVEHNGKNFDLDNWDDDEQGKEIKSIAKMLEDAVENDRVKEVKQVLKHFYKQGLNYEGDKPEHPITLEDWNKEWDRAMKQGDDK